ncbi:MAG: MFS transporter [Ardenticatenaceae bacterium]|nr:MFS transporter [Ardenticatenaceae bacterium]
MNNSYFLLLRQRPQFRLLWLASLISMMGDWFNTIASVIIVNRYTDTGLAVGALFLARALPPFLMGPFAGVLADRFNRKTILIATDLLRAVIVLGFLFVDRPERVWLIYVLTIAQFVVSAFFEPARAAILPTLVQGGEELLVANTLSSATWSAMLAFGAAIGGFTAALFGATTALVIDSITFFLSAILLWRITAVALPAAPDENSNGWRDFIDGLRYVRQHHDVGLYALVKAMGQIGSADIMIAIFAERIFPGVGQEGAGALGLLFTAAGVGSILGPLLGNYLTDGSVRALQQAIGVGFMALFFGWATLGWSPSLPVAMLGLMIRFMGGSLNWTYSSVLLQIKVPDKFLGRVFALDFGLFTLAMAGSVWLTGLALDQASLTPRQISFILAFSSLLPTLIWAIASRRSQRRLIPAEQEVS